MPNHVMLSTAKHLAAGRDRPYHVMLSAAKHLAAEALSFTFEPCLKSNGPVTQKIDES